MSSSTLRVFVSSTSKDLRLHRQAAQELILAQDWQPVMMEHFGTSADVTVRACRQKVEACDLLLLLVAFRRGWVPTLEQGGDGRRSVTAYELEAARRRNIPVRVLLARESWPGSLWEDEQSARDWMREFRANLNQLAVFFEPEPVREGAEEPPAGSDFRTKVRQLLLDHRDWLRKQVAQEAAAGSDALSVAGAAAVLPALEPLLAEVVVPQRELVQAYQRSAPPGWESLPPYGNSALLLIHAVRSLARAPRQKSDGFFPLLAFVQLLFPYRQGEAAVKLNDWLDHAIHKLARDEGDATKLRASLAALDLVEAPPPSCHLLVQVAPRVCSADAYSVKAWLLGTGQPACLLAGEEEYTRDDLPAVLDELRLEIARRRIDPDQLWVEFLLPRELLCADVDQWKVELDFIDAIPVGVEHRVVVRSLERIRRPRAAQSSKTRWESFKRCDADLRLVCGSLQTPDLQSITCLHIDRDDCGGPALYTRLQGARGVVCAVLGRPPKPAPANPANDVLNTLLAAGVSVALWTRQPPTDSHLASNSGLIHGATLTALPDWVWDLRRQAILSDDTQHPGRHVTLLWDDPTRLSPDFDPDQQLRPPQREV